MTASPDPIAELTRLIAASRRITFFGGAGVSTESGIPDFRSADGIYSEAYRRTLRPEEVVSHSFLERDPATFFDFYREKLIYPDARPDAAHLALARLEREDKLLGVVTQNIDGLDEMAGTHRVAELHGTTMRNYCVDCGRSYTRDWMYRTTGVPRCKACGGMVRPDVVLYEEGLDESVIEQAVSWIRAADLLIVAGTSLQVYPAAGLIRYYSGHHLVLINKTPTPADTSADLIIHAPVGQVMAQAAGLDAGE
jgi:NAD-dependent deacetylase